MSGWFDSGHWVWLSEFIRTQGITGWFLFHWQKISTGRGLALRLAPWTVIASHPTVFLQTCTALSPHCSQSLKPTHLGSELLENLLLRRGLQTSAINFRVLFRHCYSRDVLFIDFHKYLLGCIYSHYKSFGFMSWCSPFLIIPCKAQESWRNNYYICSALRCPWIVLSLHI